MERRGRGRKKQERRVHTDTNGGNGGHQARVWGGRRHGRIRVVAPRRSTDTAGGGGWSGLLARSGGSARPSPDPLSPVLQFVAARHGAWWLRNLFYLSYLLCGRGRGLEFDACFKLSSTAVGFGPG